MCIGVDCPNQRKTGRAAQVRGGLVSVQDRLRQGAQQGATVLRVAEAV